MNIDRKLKQDVTYWAPEVGRDVFGETSGWAAPVALKGRWEEKQETFVDINARETISKAVVYLNATVVASGRLLLGTSAELEPIAGSYEIRNNNNSPSVDATQALRKVMMA